MPPTPPTDREFELFTRRFEAHENHVGKRLDRLESWIMTALGAAALNLLVLVLK